MPKRKGKTPHQKLVLAAKRGTGIRLNADEVYQLGKMDDAIMTAAANDDETDAEERQMYSKKANP